ncbi:MAG: acyl-ACP thioesterase domain-containing protein [Solirubrobacteraceae bacterium]
MKHEFNALLAPLPGGRVFAQERRPGFADCAPSGRMRLDAIAGWLQDIAYADVEDAGLAQAAVWVVRRTRIRVLRWPRFGERFGVSTFCSGLGRMWAERRTDVVLAGETEALVQAVSLWVHLAPENWRPVPLTEDEIATYGGTVTERRISARLRHGPPPEATERGVWRFRLTECDIAAHVNNAAYWQPLEEELLAAPEPAAIDVELEYRTPAQAGEKAVLRAGRCRWITGGEGEVHASLVIGAPEAADV